ncbi:hypothetical protein G6F57_017464 [Rhizopus arrhizus]|nr:hypothetical protein G6F65_017962 [Rhizopus arrhizus]KAG1445881.1 hypothetical protein G6F57_017464 [Rhizopus arrhizus]
MGIQLNTHRPHRVGRVSHRPVQQRNIEASQCIAGSVLAVHDQRSTANGADVLQQPQFFQHKAGIGPKRHAGPHGCRLRSALIDPRVVTLLAQSQCHAQACDAAAKYSNFQGESLLSNRCSMHGSPLRIEQNGILNSATAEN